MRACFSNMADMERNRSLKEALFESLTAILSPMHDVRAAGEEQIKALEVTEGLYQLDNSVNMFMFVVFNVKIH